MIVIVPITGQGTAQAMIERFKRANAIEKMDRSDIAIRALAQD
jgi:hypothetical protein